jgi:serine phosphatase RsbU (regulator of sigma subunit)
MLAMAERREIQRNIFGNNAASAPENLTGVKAAQTLPIGRDHSPTIRSLKEELDAVRREQAKLQQSIYEAAQVQRKLCAPRELLSGEFEIAGEIFPVRHLSGDFFKVMQLDSVLVLALGDIAGKGMTAGIWQAYVMALVQRFAALHSDPANAVAEINRELCEDQSERPMTALFLARLDPRTNELIYCNAGLPAPLLVRQDNSVERLDKGGPMLGALQQAPYASGIAQLNPGDMLMAYSDGVTECRNYQEQEFEMKRLSAAAIAVSGTSANQALFRTLATVLDFADGCAPGDDMTLLVVRRRASPYERLRSNDKDLPPPQPSSGSLARTKRARPARKTVPKLK